LNRVEYYVVDTEVCTAPIDAVLAFILQRYLNDLCRDEDLCIIIGLYGLDVGIDTIYGISPVMTSRKPNALLMEYDPSRVRVDFT